MDFVLIIPDVNLPMVPINSERIINQILDIKLNNVEHFSIKDNVHMAIDVTFYTIKKLNKRFL
jgi:hypothetical protein